MRVRPEKGRPGNNGKNTERYGTTQNGSHRSLHSVATDTILISYVMNQKRFPEVKNILLTLLIPMR